MDKKNVGSLFDSIAGTYDRFNHLLSLNIDKRWRRKSVKRMATAGKVLDVAVGTGDLAMEMIRQDKACHVTGIDISTGMMEVGKTKALKAGMQDRISFMEASAFEMPFEDGSFDAVTCAYGVRNFAHLNKGLAEMYRVLRDGGELMILEFSYPENRIIRALYDFFFSNIMPLVGKLISRNGSAYIYFRNSVKNFIWGRDMASMIELTGFRDVTFQTMTFGITTVYFAKK